MMGRGIYVKLSPAMIAEADEAARMRQDNAVEELRTPGNNLRAGDGDLALNVLGCRCERAAKVAFEPIEWHKFKRGRLDDLADLGDFIDVKGVDKDERRLLVPRGRLHVDWAYLLVSAENFPYYWIAGWMWGSELVPHLESSFGPYVQRPAYLAGHDLLHPTFTLQRIARARA
jgi:hypothetical protein